MIVATSQKGAPMRIRRVTILALLGLGLMGAGQERPRITLGAVLPMSGPQAPFGKEAERGIQLALATVKASDPTVVEAWTLVIADDQSSSKEAGAAAAKVVAKDHAHILLGDVTGPSTIEVANVAKAQKRLLVSPMTTSPAIAIDPL